MSRKYSWSFDEKAEKQFRKLDTPIQVRILKWMESNIQGCENPRLFGKALEGEYENLWRYRIGKYCLVADIKEGIFKVLVVKVGKRSDVYRR
ncbi:MAG: type II toxin-antitoxin system RelE/ParE family toxin [Coriobacteriales bacterium]|jgi:mRNA interferase RelE/StbE|nr:type II toxin-antitoxin system RelE/ParE family toxin [Coriobacteriales bacterium]